MPCTCRQGLKKVPQTIRLNPLQCTAEPNECLSLPWNHTSASQKDRTEKMKKSV